jgi:hypothetical protein
VNRHAETLGYRGSHLPQRQLIFLGLGIFALMLGLLSGIFMLMADNGFGHDMLGVLYAYHPVLMVYGFIAPLIMTERVAGLRPLRPRLRLKFTATLMAPLTWLGAMVYTAARMGGTNQVAVLGDAFMLLGGLMFVATLYSLASMSHLETPFEYMVLSVFFLLVGALELGFTPPAYNMDTDMLFLGFPVVFVLGERVELMGFLTAAHYRRLFVSVAFALTLSLIVFGVGSAIFILRGQRLETINTIGVVPFLVAFAAYYAVERRTFRRLASSAQPIQRYVAPHTQTAYLWGIIGSLLLLFYYMGLQSERMYDATIHAFAIGFVGSMFLAHAPIIFPTVAQRTVDQARLRLWPLRVLTVAVALRVFGDLIMGVHPDPTLGVALWLSGWLVLLIVVGFLATLVNMSRPKQIVKAGGAPNPTLADR